MAQSKINLEGVDKVFSDFTAAAGASREEALQAWTRGCELYARYFTALARAHDPQSLMAANAEFVSSSMEAIGRTAANLGQKSPPKPPSA